MATSLIIGIVVLAALAVIGIAVTLRRRDNNAAFGQMTEASNDASSSSDLVSAGGASASTAASSKEIEKSALGGAPGTLVPADAGPPAVYVPPDAETIGVARRQFLNRSILALTGVSLAAFGASILGMLWPGAQSGFGSVITVGRIADIKASISAGGGFFYVPEGRMWITEYPANAVAKAATGYDFYDQVSQGLEVGVVALYQTCPHLGCRVPECATSQWFECPCHGSQYNRVGEKKGGPAPRGMDRFPMTVSAAGALEVDTGVIIQGPAIGVNTTGQEAEGPNCLGAGGH